MEYRKSVIAQDESISAGAVTTYDLPVNPLSHIVFTLKGLNVTDEATLAEILARISKVEVTRYGQNILSMSGADLHKFNAVLFGKMPILRNQVATDNATRALTFILPFGRKLYDPTEGLPATNKGELKLQITLSSTETAIDGIIYQIEAAEMIGASPTKYLKTTTISKTPTSGVDNDVDLPLGNKLAGLLLYSTTVPTTTAWTTTIDKIKFLINNIEKMIVASNWESLHGELLMRVGHLEQYDGSADTDDLVNYAFVDFFPTGNDDYLVETNGVSDAVLRVTAGDGNAIRILPMEIVSV